MCIVQIYLGVWGEINFGNNIVEIVRKSKRDERQMIWQEGERKVILAIAEIAIDQ